MDETGADKRTHIRKYGYALCGMTPTCRRLLVRGNRTNAIVAMSSDGVVAAELTSSTVNGDSFFDFTRGSLLPLMQPFDGSSPHSVLVMDNCSIHHTSEVKDLQQAGVILFLPSYSPDLNPIEEAFFVKGYLRKHDQLLQVVQDLSLIHI